MGSSDRLLNLSNEDDGCSPVAISPMPVSPGPEVDDEDRRGFARQSSARLSPLHRCRSASHSNDGDDDDIPSPTAQSPSTAHMRDECRCSFRQGNSNTVNKGSAESPATALSRVSSLMRLGCEDGVKARRRSSTVSTTSSLSETSVVVPLKSSLGRFKGAISKKEAEEMLPGPTAFLLYYRLPPAYQALQAALPLVVAYMTSFGDYRHYDIEETENANGGKLYRVKNEDPNPPMCNSIDALMRHYEIYSQIERVATADGTVVVDVFPWWLDNGLGDTAENVERQIAHAIARQQRHAQSTANQR